MDEDQSGGIVLNDLDRLARGDELNAKRATEEAARLARAADKSLRLRDEFNLTRYMFQRGSVDWDPLDPKCQKRAVTKGNMKEFITKIGLEKAFKSEMKRAVDQCPRDEIADFLISRVKKLDDVDEYVVDYERCDSDDEEEAQDWEEVDGCEEEKKFIGNIFVDKFVEDDDQFKWGMIVDVLTNRSFSEFPGEPFFKYYDPKKCSRRKPTSEESYEFTACKELLQESSDYEWREKVE